MAHLVVKDNITSGGALAVGQTLRLGGFVMITRSAVATTMTSRAIDSNLHISSELAEQLDPMELFSLNELLDRIAALGVATDYGQIGLKPDQRDNGSPQVTHHIEVVEEQCGESPPILRTRCVRIPDPSKRDIRGGEDVAQALNLKSGSRPDSLNNVQENKLPSSEISWPLSLRSGEVPDLNTPAHPNIRDLSQIRQEPTETVHHY